jgi:hypothetical protein
LVRRRVGMKMRVLMRRRRVGMKMRVLMRRRRVGIQVKVIITATTTMAKLNYCQSN